MYAYLSLDMYLKAVGSGEAGEALALPDPILIFPYLNLLSHKICTKSSHTCSSVTYITKSVHNSNEA